MFLQRLDNGTVFAVLQDYHQVLAGQFAAAWGNEEFDRADPGAVYMARNHDAGWTEHDSEPGIDPASGLPWHIIDMHPSDLNPIHRRSIERNARNDRYTGILSCMHTMGFYNGRMGQSDFAVMDGYSDEHPEHIHPMVTECTERIEAWKAEIVAEGEDAVSLESRVWRSYRWLEACDTMSIYFSLTPMAQLESHTFPNVPRRGDELTSITFTPRDGGHIAVDPYPFGADPLTVFLNGRLLQTPIADSAGDALAASRGEQVVYTLSPG